MTTYDQMAATATTPNVAAGESPPEFKFTQPGQAIFGQVIRVQFGFTTKFGEANIIEVNDHQYGPITVWLSNVQTRSAFVEGNNPLGRPVQVGDIVFARFDNLQPLEGGKTVKNFSVNVQPGSPAAAQQAQPVQAPVQQYAPPAHAVQTGSPHQVPPPQYQQPAPGPGPVQQAIQQAHPPAQPAPQPAPAPAVTDNLPGQPGPGMPF